MRTKLIALMALFTMALASCTPLNIHDFEATYNGVEYHFEVIIPLMNYVRITPITPDDQLTGEVVLPSSVNYQDIRYAVTQVGKRAFEGYTGITKVTLPSVSVIEERAFKGCTALREINLPRTVATIEAYAFDSCSALESIELPSSLSTLEKGCFRDCSALTGVIFPPSLSSIPNNAFEGCTALEEIYIDLVTVSIGSKAFYGCSGVTDLTCRGLVPPSASSNTFEGMNPDITVNVPSVSVSLYQSATGWSYFNHFEGREDLVPESYGGGPVA